MFLRISFIPWKKADHSRTMSSSRRANFHSFFLRSVLGLSVEFGVAVIQESTSLSENSCISKPSKALENVMLSVVSSKVSLSCDEVSILQLVIRMSIICSNICIQCACPSFARFRISLFACWANHPAHFFLSAKMESKIRRIPLGSSTLESASDIVIAKARTSASAIVVAFLARFLGQAVSMCMGQRACHHIPVGCNSR